MSNKSTFEISEKNRLRRVANRGAYDRETVFRIFDQAWICRVAIFDHQATVVIPMLHARIGDALIFHGATTSRLMKSLSSGNQVCLSVANLNGFGFPGSAQ